MELPVLSPAVQAVIAAVSGFVIVALVFLICFLIFSGRKKQQDQTRSVESGEARRSRSHVGLISRAASFDPSVPSISMPELIKATDNFNEAGVVGDGSFGLVYKARLGSGQLVAVKKLGIEAFQGLREFQAEMETLGRVRHKNIVKILGYCIAGRDRVLIYEYVRNGCLDHWLHGDSPDSDSSKLTWPIRLKIIKGIAAGLAFLHCTCTPAIIHRDIKSSNVLLDEEFEAHIADFGLARRMNPLHSHVSTQVAGTMGYIPPEYKDGLAATVKGDVYSFGILMMEVATGRRPNLAVEERLDQGRVKLVWLVDWIKELVSTRREMEAVDPVISDHGILEGQEMQVREFFKIACICTKGKHRERPDMPDLVSLLEQL